MHVWAGRCHIIFVIPGSMDEKMMETRETDITTYDSAVCGASLSPNGQPTMAISLRGAKRSLLLRSYYYMSAV
jgi:hypothetical protein